MIGLRFNGLKPTTKFIWRRAFVDENTNTEWDIDTDLEATLSKPVIEKVHSGAVVKAAFPVDEKSLGHLNRLLKSQIDKGLAEKYELKEHSMVGKRPSFRPFTLNMDHQFHLLIIKMCLALIEKFDQPKSLVSSEIRSKLTNGMIENGIARSPIEPFTALRNAVPPLSHAILIEVNAGKCYGVVQLFGTFQYYVELNGESTTDMPTLFGVLDIVNHEESFSEIKPMSLAAPPMFITVIQCQLRWNSWMAQLNEQVLRAFGKNEVLF